MSRPRPRRRDEELLGALERALVPRRRSSLPGLLWAWRRELVLGAGIAVLFAVVMRTSGIAWAVAGLSAVVGAFSPPWSEQMKAFAWQLITPHRLRAGLYHARIHNRHGRRPVIMRVTSEPFGERIRLWCPPGTSAEDLHHARQILRAACWARDVQVARDEQRAHLVTMDVIRRSDDVELTGDDEEAISSMWR